MKINQQIFEYPVILLTDKNQQSENVYFLAE